MSSGNRGCAVNGGEIKRNGRRRRVKNYGCGRCDGAGSGEGFFDDRFVEFVSL